MKNSLALLILLSMLLILDASYAQMVTQPTSLIYVTVEPQKSALVKFATEDELVDAWPLGGFVTERFYFTALPQGRYLYISVQPYGCYEVLNIDVSPREIVVRWEKDRAILFLNVDYVNVRVVLYEVPGDRCEYFTVGSFRVKKVDVLYATVAVLGSTISVLAAYEIKNRRRLKKKRKEKYELELKERLDHFKESLKRIRYVKMNDPLCLTVDLLLSPSYDLDKLLMEDLYESIVDDRVLNQYVERLLRNLKHNDALSIFLEDVEYSPRLAIGLKTYLAILGFIPSSTKVLEDFLMKGYGRVELTDSRDVFEILMKLIKENIDVHEECLRNVYKLMNEKREYRNRIYNPHPYYSTILREIEKRTGHKIGLRLRSINMEEREEPAIIETKIVGDRVGGSKPSITEESEKTSERVFHIEDISPPDDVRRMVVGLLEKKEKIYGVKKSAEREEKKEDGVEIELPRYLRRQIEGLKIPLGELVESARRYLESGEEDTKTLFREADKLVEKYGIGMDEESKISMLTMLTTIIPLVAREIRSIRVMGGKPQEIKEVKKPNVEDGVGGIRGAGTIEHPEIDVKNAVMVGEPAGDTEALRGVNIREVVYRDRVEVKWGQIYLVPYFEALPTFMLLDMLDAVKCIGIPVELRKEKIIEEVRKAIITGRTPVVVVGRRGFLQGTGRKNREYYVEKLKEIVSFLREERLLHRLGFLMLENIYLEYNGLGLREGWSVFKLNLTSKNVLQSVVESFKKNDWVDEKIIEFLVPATLISPRIREALKAPTVCLDKEIEKARRSGDDEAEAVFWALKKIIELRRPLVEEDIPEEYRKHATVLKELKLIEEVKKTG